MTKRLLVYAALSVVTVAACNRPMDHHEARPNVFLLVIDALRADRLSWSGPGRGVSPFLDSLAARGTVFSHAYSAAPWTLPSIASLFTSRYQSQHGITKFSSVLDGSEQTLAEELQHAGYATAGFTANMLLAAKFGFSQGFDNFYVYNEAPIKERASRLNADALRWIDRTRRKQPQTPLFLYLHYMEVHEPLQPPIDAVEAVGSAQGLDAPTLTRLKEMATAGAPQALLASESDMVLVQDLYDAELVSLDQQLRQLFLGLENRDLLSTSVVVITADHGQEMGDHGGGGHGHTLYNELIHVPLLIMAPAQGRRLDVHDSVSLVDMAPTILDAIHISAPSTFEGRSRFGAIRHPWVAQLLSPATRLFSSSTSYSELNEEGSSWLRPKLHQCSLVVGDQKLIERRDGQIESYDLTQDPDEKNSAGLPPLAVDALRAQIKSLRDKLKSRSTREKTGVIDDETRERMRALGYRSD